jgi:hypothetical protein
VGTPEASPTQRREGFGLSLTQEALVLEQRRSKNCATLAYSVMFIYGKVYRTKG